MANLEIACAFARFLAAQGVREVVVCPGSRNAPLIFTLQAAGALDIYHHLDERSAAFFALGLAQKKKPVAVITTSGTAVAELLPAAVEAYYQRAPLIFVSADRPARFRGTGAPQAIDQVGIFSRYAESFDISSADFPPEVKFPCHLNICLEEPQQGDWPKDFSVAPREPLRSAPAPIQYLSNLEKFCESSDELLVVVGSLRPEEAQQVAPFLERLQAPILADSTSNLPASALWLSCGEKLLRQRKPSHVLRLGTVPSFRFWRDLESNSLEVLSLCPAGWSGLGRPSQLYCVTDFSQLGQLELSPRAQPEWHAQDRLLAQHREELLRAYPHSELAFIRRLAAEMSPAAMLYLGNSMPVREWNLVNGAHTLCFANRGANGIDGQVSTFLGAAQGRAESWALVGDQTAMYDLNALALSNQHGRHLSRQSPKRRIVVLNNGGGKIFSHLSYSASLEAGQRKILENQHRWDFRAWADLYAWSYDLWQKDDCLWARERDDVILEIIPDSLQTHHFWTEWRKT